MWSNSILWIKRRYHRIVNSIAFYPAFIALLFLVLSFGMIVFDFSEAGKQIKLTLSWLTLKDASTARSIISAIAAGVISLAVFSFSMVMIVLNQAASQMSNRVLDKLIGNRFQQVVLGIYIGTIVYALFLLSTIRDINSGVYVPALSTYLLIAITIFDIFLFIYFLHYITQSVKYEVIIQRICKETNAVLKRSCKLEKEEPETGPLQNDHHIHAVESGIYEGFNALNLVKLCDENDCSVYLMHVPGTFILRGLPLAQLSKPLPDEAREEMRKSIFLHDSETIEENFFYGFRQLAEVAIKALSPGINDPGTAIISLRSLFSLLTYRAHHFPENTIVNDKDQVRIFTNTLSFEKIFEHTILPIWSYGKNDRMIAWELHHLLAQLYVISPNASVKALLTEVKQVMVEHHLFKE